MNSLVQSVIGDNPFGCVGYTGPGTRLPPPAGPPGTEKTAAVRRLFADIEDVTRRVVLLPSPEKTANHDH